MGKGELHLEAEVQCRGWNCVQKKTLKSSSVMTHDLHNALKLLQGNDLRRNELYLLCNPLLSPLNPYVMFVSLDPCPLLCCK